MWPAEVLQGRARAFTVEVGAERYLELMGRKR
jgi:hypothetical protein